MAEPRLIEISPVTRVEGHGKVTIHLDQDGFVDEARLHIVEFRGFERFIRGRLLWEVPVIVQRLCGICPVSHHLGCWPSCWSIITVQRLNRMLNWLNLKACRYCCNSTRSCASRTSTVSTVLPIPW